MMKSSILVCLALISLTLSYFFEKAPAHASPDSAPLSSLLYAPETITDGQDLINLLAVTYEDDGKGNFLSFKDSLFYNYYAQTLGLNLDFTEDKQLLEKVNEWIGTPYRYGNSSKKGTDCSGFVTRIYKDVYGIDLRRSSHSMFGDVKRVKKDQMQAGDIVFFRRSPKGPIYHVGIYLSDNKIVHSATNGGVMINSLSESYYKKNFYAAGRVKS
ncbi:NlpC/P60 family protein [soil metagenome]